MAVPPRGADAQGAANTATDLPCMMARHGRLSPKVRDGDGVQRRWSVLTQLPADADADAAPAAFSTSGTPVWHAPKDDMGGARTHPNTDSPCTPQSCAARLLPSLRGSSSRRRLRVGSRHIILHSTPPTHAGGSAWAAGMILSLHFNAGIA